MTAPLARVLCGGLAGLGFGLWCAVLAMWGGAI